MPISQSNHTVAVNILQIVCTNIKILSTMKKIFLITLAFASIGASAQFFQHNYGTKDSENASNGLNTTATGLGHFIVSSTFNSPTNEILAVNTDINGNVAAFNNLYTLTHSSGVLLDIDNTLPIEFSNGSGYGIFGRFHDPGLSIPTGIFYLEIDPAGNILNVTEYNPISTVGTNYYVVEVADVTESLGGGFFYITGTVDPSIMGNFWIFVIKIDQAGNIIWSIVDDLVNSTSVSRDWAKGIVESPYSPSGTPELVVVGQTYDGGGSADAFLVRLDANSGTSLAPVNLYGTTTSNEIFNSIKIANNTISGAPGFIIGGSSDINSGGANRDFWLLQTDDQGNPFWSYTYDYNGSSGNNDYSTDVIERLNTGGLYEYYLGGHTNNGNLGGADLVVIKTDNLGNAVGQFTYGSPSDDVGTYLDYYDLVGPDGLSVFGTYNGGGIGLMDTYHVKAYFNGLSGCNENLGMTHNLIGPGLFMNLQDRLKTTFKNVSMTSALSSAKDANLCFNFSIPGGSNARVAPAEPKGDKEAKISPNPIAQGVQYANVEIDIEKPTTAQVSVYDMLGRSYYAQTFTLVKGKNNLVLDISNINMAQGMYTVKIQGENLNQNIALLVK